MQANALGDLDSYAFSARKMPNGIRSGADTSPFFNYSSVGFFTRSLETNTLESAGTCKVFEQKSFTFVV